MKRVRSLMLFVFLLAACSTNTEFPWKKGAFSDVVSNAGSKIIMVDFYTEW